MNFNFDSIYEKVERDIQESILRKMLENDYNYMKSQEDFIRKNIELYKQKMVVYENIENIEKYYYRIVTKELSDITGLKVGSLVDEYVIEYKIKDYILSKNLFQKIGDDVKMDYNLCKLMRIRNNDEEYIPFCIVFEKIVDVNCSKYYY